MKKFKVKHFLATQSFVLFAIVLSVINCGMLFGEDFKIIKKTSFEEVTSKLDKNGDFYFYLNTADFLSSIEEVIEQTTSMLTAIPSQNETDKKNMLSILSMIQNFILNSGLQNISGVGVSSIAIEKDFYRNKFILHRPKEKNQGELWKLFGTQPHPLETLDLLPKDTALAGFSDINLLGLWQWISKEINNSGNEKIISEFNKMQVDLKNQQGIDLTKLLTSINNKIGLIITLDSNKVVPIPIQRNIIQIPEPSLALVVYVNDDYIFNIINSKCPPSMKRVNDDKSKKILMEAIPMLPVKFGPSVVQQDNMLIIASNLDIITNIFDAKINKNGFKTTEEFKRLSKNIPTNGNAFDLITPVFGEVYISFYKQMLNANKTLSPEIMENINKMFLDEQTELSLYNVFENTEEGFVTTFNSNVKAGPILIAAGTIAPISILAAMLLPSLSGVQNKAKVVSCLANLNGLGKAMLLSADDREDCSYPKTLDQLVQERYATPGLLRCKYTGKKYIYKSGYSTSDDQNKILIICDHGKLGGNYLTVGGFAINYKAGNKPKE